MLVARIRYTVANTVIGNDHTITNFMGARRKPKGQTENLNEMQLGTTPVRHGHSKSVHCKRKESSRKGGAQPRVAGLAVHRGKTAQMQIC